ncbi:ArnT family glycosyltransferase [Nonomuraea rubra]|uniref:ArnT family glycosyltransferase n=1 Tax=Nonomuraea rubra TaxID=46180 RepID=UPI0033CB7545
MVTDTKSRWALAVLLAGTGALYLWGLGASGWANSFYSAAVQAGSQSWKAFFYGASDAASAITVDKTPASLWPMVLSVRLFGLSSWAILVPQALMGVGSVAMVYASVRRLSSAWAGLLAGAVMALTPVAVLMFRFNNPDALLVLPGFALVYLVTAPVAFWRRVRQLLLAGAAMVVAAGWWLLAVALVPASERPYIGGSQTNSVLELALGYNGIGRLNGENYGGLGNLNQEAGWLRLFDTEAGGQISWLLPAALVLLVAATWLARRAPRTDPVRAALWVWGSWLVVTGLIFSLMQGIFHAYYTVALAPAIAALVGLGTAVLWERGAHRAPAVVTAGTAVWSYVLLSRSSGWNPWLGVVVLVAGLGTAPAMLLPRRLLAVVVVAVVACLAGPAAYAVDTAASPHTGAIPTAGPSTGGGFQRPTGSARGRPPGGVQGRGGMGRMGGGGMGGLLNAAAPSDELTALLESGASGYTWAAATVGSNNAAGYQLATELPVMAVGGFNGTDPAPTLERFKQYVAEKQIRYFIGTGMGGAGRSTGGSDDAARIAAWVQETFTATTVGGTTVFDLTAS